MNKPLQRPLSLEKFVFHAAGFSNGNVAQMDRDARALTRHVAGSNPAIPFAESARSAGAPGAGFQIVGAGNFEGVTHIGVIRKPYGER